MTAEWPVELRGVTETIVATRGPNERWNLAALGVEAPGDDEPATARTWGQTRTRRNFSERGGGHVQFTRDPAHFVEAALGTFEQEEPVLRSADAVVQVAVERIDEGKTRGTGWVDWSLEPVDATVEREIVPTTNRGYNAVVEGTVAASRLDVDAYDEDVLRERLSYFESVVERCGGSAEQAAWERLQDLVEANW